MKRFLLLFTCLSLFVGIKTANAEIISPSFTYINYQHNPLGNLYQGLSQLPTLYHANPNFNVLFTIYIPTEKEHFNQVRVGFCTTNPEKITKFDVVNDNTGEGALANRNIKFISTNIKCSNISDTYNFQYVYAYFDVLDWKDTTIGGGTIGYSYLESYINGYTSGNNYIYLNDIVIADTDLYTSDYTAYRDYNVITNQKIDITNDKLDNIEDSITSEEPPTKLDNLSNSAGWLPAGPVDSILNLPLTMFQNLSNNIGSSCTPLVIKLPYVDENINLPCLNSIYEQIDGLSVWINSIGTIASAFILYSYLLKLYKWVDDTLTFRENNSIDNWGGI